MAGKQKQLTITFFPLYILRVGIPMCTNEGSGRRILPLSGPSPLLPAVLSTQPSSLKLLRRPEEWEEGKNLILERGSWLVGWGNGQRTAGHLRRAITEMPGQHLPVLNGSSITPRKQCMASSPGVCFLLVHAPTSEPFPQTLGNALQRE